MTRYAARTTLAALTLAGAGWAQAADVNSINTLDQAKFRLLSEDIGSAISYKGLVPAEGLGITGFDIGVSAGVTKVKNTAVLSEASSNSGIHTNLPLVAVRAHKGLPFDLDLGVSLSSLPGTNIRSTGGELRWAFIPGGMATPALAVRLSGSFLSGVDNLKMRTTGVDLSISKGFMMLTPYAGIGQVSVKSTGTISNGAGGTVSNTQKFNQGKVFAGVNVNFGLANLAVETDKTGDDASYGVKFGLRF
ncbi:MAG: hypothetical protein RLZZ584_1245 [Pseudomonadota bacterium]|jgi:hypothetical protein